MTIPNEVLVAVLSVLGVLLTFFIWLFRRALTDISEIKINTFEAEPAFDSRQTAPSMAEL